MLLKTENLCFSYGKEKILNNISIEIKTGEVVSILGPNGAGKTTLFKCLLGFLQPKSGHVLINNKAINECSKKELSNQIAYIPQSYNPAFGLSVLDSVLMGVTNKLGLFEQPSVQHKEIAMNLLKDLGIENLADRSCSKISGGERSLMLIARALIQDAKILIMDEPTASLDYGNSLKLMKIINSLKDKGYTVVFSTHDPILAKNYSTRTIAIKNGEILSDTDADKVSSAILTNLYGVDVVL